MARAFIKHLTTRRELGTSLGCGELDFIRGRADFALGRNIWMSLVEAGHRIPINHEYQ